MPRSGISSCRTAGGADKMRLGNKKQRRNGAKIGAGLHLPAIAPETGGALRKSPPGPLQHHRACHEHPARQGPGGRCTCADPRNFGARGYFARQWNEARRRPRKDRSSGCFSWPAGRRAPRACCRRHHDRRCCAGRGGDLGHQDFQPAPALLVGRLPSKIRSLTSPQLPSPASLTGTRLATWCPPSQNAIND